IKQSSNAVINISTGGGLGMTLEQRLAAANRASPEMASLNMGSMNFGIFPLLDKYDSWIHDWEPEFLGMTNDFIFRNTFKDIEYVLKNLGEEHGTKFEMECYDLGHLYNVAHFVDRGLIKPPFFLQMIYGILGGAGAEIDNLVHMNNVANRLFGDDYEWSVLAEGKNKMGFASNAGVLVGNVRVGLEDSLYIGRGELAKSNADQVAKIRRIVEDMSLTVATPDEARERLQLKGGDAVGF
ncbi:MAG: 3-keto-5-aminohexanoate cleavage protein, partial [Alphaproteobacteria bacterium]|nr:3-keto-5-aminohexanoate cleavage protein [Alphaproteobacteria bacterium]